MTIRCLKLMRKSFDCYLNEPPIDRAVTAFSNSLDYAAIFWIRHLSELDKGDEEALKIAMHILHTHAVEWLELLDLRHLLTEAMTIMDKLGAVLTVKVCFIREFETPKKPRQDRWLTSYSRALCSPVSPMLDTPKTFTRRSWMPEGSWKLTSCRRLPRACKRKRRSGPAQRTLLYSTTAAVP